MRAASLLLVAALALGCRRAPSYDRSTPEKTLRGYERVHLERGQTETVRFRITPDDLSFIGRDGRPVTEPGEFEVMVGSSSRDEDLLRARFTLLG